MFFLYIQHSKNENVYLFVVSNTQSFTPTIFGVVGTLGVNLDFFSPVGFDIQRDSGHETRKIKVCSVRALKCYLNVKNLVHGGGTAAASSKYSA